MNYCDHGHGTEEEVRLLPTSDGVLHGNIILCKTHFRREMNFRKEMFQLGIWPSEPPFHTWESLKIYVSE